MSLSCTPADGSHPDASFCPLKDQRITVSKDTRFVLVSFKTILPTSFAPMLSSSSFTFSCPCSHILRQPTTVTTGLPFISFAHSLFRKPVVGCDGLRNHGW